tara:strand:- start:2468 stop:2821 length:354 start_codon:yes stop_codon:yes gene_type:complete
MSSRRPKQMTALETANKIRNDITQMKKDAMAVEAASAKADVASAATSGVVASPSTATNALTPVEQAAGSLGVDPEAWKPIKFMNNAHYDSLLTANALDDNLARRIEAYRNVSGASTK